MVLIHVLCFPHPTPFRCDTQLVSFSVYHSPVAFISLTLNFCNPLFPLLSLSLFTYQCSIMYVLAQCASRLAGLTSVFYLYHPTWLYWHDGVSRCIKILGFSCLIPTDSSSFNITHTEWLFIIGPTVLCQYQRPLWISWSHDGTQWKSLETNGLSFLILQQEYELGVM